MQKGSMMRQSWSNWTLIILPQSTNPYWLFLQSLEANFGEYKVLVDVDANDIVAAAPGFWWRRCLSTWRSGTKSHLERYKSKMKRTAKAILTKFPMTSKSCGINTCDLTAGSVGRTLAPPWTCLTPDTEEMEIRNNSMHMKYYENTCWGRLPRLGI